LPSPNKSSRWRDFIYIITCRQVSFFTDQLDKMVVSQGAHFAVRREARHDAQSD
jgi:hypothetical protein